MNKIFTVANCISLLRLVAGFCFIPLNNLFHFNNLELFLIIFVAWFSDIADGWAARRLNQISDTGKLIDPLADKIFMFFLVLNFLFTGRISLFYLICVVGRDLLILAGGFYLTKKYKTILPSNLMGKLCVFSIGIYFLTVLTGISIVMALFQIISIVFIIASLLVYFFRAYEFIKDTKYVY